MNIGMAGAITLDHLLSQPAREGELFERLPGYAWNEDGRLSANRA